MIRRRELFAKEVCALRQSCLQPGCPVETGELLVLEIPVQDPSGCPFLGQLQVARELAGEVERIMSRVLECGYPIWCMRSLSDFGGDDRAAMAANNTSCFNGRRVAGSTRWSWHAYGRAIDLNPVENPWIRCEGVEPPAGCAHLVRETASFLVLTSEHPVVKIFEAEGWEWGGHWKEKGPDYHHFQKPVHAHKPD